MPALTYDPEPFDDHTLRERTVCDLPVVGEGAGVLRGEVGSDAEGPAEPRALHESGGSQLRGGEGASSSEVPEGAQHSESAPSVKDLLDAVSVHGDACAALQDAMRANRATGSALLVCRETYRRVIELAHALNRDAA